MEIQEKNNDLGTTTNSEPTIEPAETDTNDIVSESLRRPVCPEKVLEAHCKLATSIRHNGVDQTPQDRLIDMLRRVYRSGKDPELEFNNFSYEFQTPQLRKALDAFEARRKKPKQTSNQKETLAPQPTNTNEPQGINNV